MPATRYRIWKKPTRAGDRWLVGVAGISKTADDVSPYVVANELISCHLARCLLLPVPPGFIVEHEGKPHYVSLDFNLAGEDLPPADPALVAEKHPKLSCGIVAFDIWILNRDRHKWNMAYDRFTDKVQIFDHGHALFVAGEDMEKQEMELAVDEHCLLPELRSVTGLQDWHERICAIPERYISDVVLAAVEVGLPQPAAEHCVQFLIRRRKNLLSLLSRHRSRFPNVPGDGWDHLEGSVP